MSKNTNLSFLTDFLTADIVNSRVGMNNVSPQNTFDVTGTGKFSGVLTLGSTVSNGTYTYTLPSATGTLALTSDIPSVSGYVPYTGASQDVNLGVNTLTSKGLNVDVIAGQGGALNLRQATNISTWNGAPFTSIYATTGNRVVIMFSNDNRQVTLDGSIVSAASPRTFTFPDATGTFALTSQIPTNAVGGTGTLNTIPKFTAATTIGNSNIFDSGSIIYNTNPAAGTFAWQFNGSTITGQSYGAQVIAGTNASDIGFKVMNAAASINYLVVRGDGLVTLTGALNGTSATFSGNITLNGAVTRNINFYNDTNSILNAQIQYDQISSNTGQLFFGTNNAGTFSTKLTISNTGAATFDTTSAISAIFNSTNASGGYLAFRRSGTNIGYLGNSAQLGIGVNNALELRADNNLYLTTTSGTLSMLSTGNVGIGTASPGLPLDVVINNSTAYLTTSRANTLRAYNISSSANVFAGIELAADGLGNAGVVGINGVVTGSGSGAMTFYTRDSSTFGERMRITSGGNVGIGTASPSAKFEVLGLSTFAPSATLTAGDLLVDTNNKTVYLGRLSNISGDNTRVIMRSRTGTIGFSYNPSDSITFFNDGNVLIGTTTDVGSKLYVNGDIRTNAILYTNDNGPSIYQNRINAGWNTIGDSTDLWINYEGYLNSTSYFRDFRVGNGKQGAAILFIDGSAGTSTFSGSVTIQGGNSLFVNNASNTRTGYLKTSSEGTELSSFAGAGEPLILIAPDTTATIRFYTGGSTVANERMRITSGGYLKVSNTGTYLGLNDSYHEFNNNRVNFPSLLVNASSADFEDQALAIYTNRNTTNNTYYAISYYNVVASAYKFRVADSGNVTNTNGSYGSISDIKLKENIVNASPKLDDLMKVKVRNYNLIGDDKKQIGVIAQELEEIFPAMIDESPDKDKDGNDLGTTTKSVKYSVFVPMLIKAIQEQQVQIDKLKNS